MTLEHLPSLQDRCFYFLLHFATWFLHRVLSFLAAILFISHNFCYRSITHTHGHHHYVHALGNGRTPGLGWAPTWNSALHHSPAEQHPRRSRLHRHLPQLACGLHGSQTLLLQAPPTSHDPKLRPVKQRCPPLWCSFAIVICWIGSEVGAWMKTCSFCYDSSCRINGRIFLILIKIFLIFMRIFIIFSLNF